VLCFRREAVEVAVAAVPAAAGQRCSENINVRDRVTERFAWPLPAVWSASPDLNITDEELQKARTRMW
jgi:hypothetical protein